MVKNRLKIGDNMKKGCYEYLTNKRFGRLLVISFHSHCDRRKTYWNCLCDCGNTVIVQTSHLKSGHTKSCGCIKNERIKFLNYKNGMAKSRLNRIYRNMINRCYNENLKMYKYYGGRGIIVCDDWLVKNNGFVNFCNWALSNGYGENLTLDRIDNDGNYTPQNCHFVDKYSQANNKRNNIIIELNGERGTIGELARKYNIDYFKLRYYVRKNKNKIGEYSLCKIGLRNG